MTDFPARGQQPPAYWDDQLRAYIDERDAAAAETGSAAATASSNEVRNELSPRISAVETDVAAVETEVAGRLSYASLDERYAGLYDPRFDTVGGGTADPASLPFSKVAVKSDINNLVTYPTAGQSVTLHTLTGAGVIRSHQMTHAVKEMSRDGRLQFFIDGETTPSIDVEIRTLYGLHDEAFVSAGNMISTDHASVSITGSSYPGTSSQTLLLPIPFSNGAVVKFLNPSVGVHSAPYGDFMFSAIQYESGAQVGVTDTYRLRSASMPFRTPLSGTRGVSLPLFNRASIAGHLVYFATTMVGGNYTYLERPWNVYVDGEASPSYRGNAEDWWNSGYYFGGMNRYSSKVASVTAANNAANVFCGAVDLLAMNGGIKFTSGLKMACGASGETKGHSGWETTDFTMGFVALYYTDSTALTQPATVPGAPTSVVATAGVNSASVAFSPPASDGGALITGYTVTSSPGGVTATGTSSPIVVTGLTANTAYTFTVTATNSAGTGPASTASNSVTPTATTIADNFNRADNASSLGSTSTGSIPWTISGPGFGTQVGKIVSNQASLINDGQGDNRVFATIDAGTANYDVSIKITAFGAQPQYPAVMARFADANNFVLLQADGEMSAGTSYGLYRKTAGAYTQLGASIPLTPTPGDVIRLVVVGTSYKAYINGVLKVDVTNTTTPTNLTRVGFAAGGRSNTPSSAMFDDFTAVQM